jgi:hypothetical protein
MKRYVIERSIPGAQQLTAEQRQGAARSSNAALARLDGKVHWMHPYVVQDKTYCIYLAENEQAVREHAALSGFPADRVSEVQGILEPGTANA